MATYYINTASTGSGDGTTIATTGDNAAWAAISEITGLSAGDSVLFNKGDTWREQLTVPTSGSSGSPIIFGAYGTGADPIINGADVVETWSQYLATAIYSAACNWTAAQVFEDATRLTFVTWDTDIATTEPDMSAGTWTLDTTNDLVYVWASDDADPDTHTMEVSIRSYAIVSRDKSYITVDSLELKYANSIAFVFSETGSTPTNATIRNCNVNYIGSHGIYFADVGGDNLIDNNVVSYCLGKGIFGYRHIGSTSGHETVVSNNIVHHNSLEGIQSQGSYWIIEKNVVYDNGILSEISQGIGVYADEIDDAIVGNYNIIRYNIVYNQSNSGGIHNGIGIVLDQWTDNNQVYYNIAYNNDGPGFVVFDGQNNELYNNVAYGNVQEPNRLLRGEFLIHDVESRTSNILVKNNIAFATSADTYAIYVSSYASGSAGLDISSNCWYRATGDWWFYDSGGGSSLATWNGKTGVGTDINADPLFVDAANGDFHIKKDSPCRNAGIDVGLMQDYDGKQVHQPADIGTYEIAGKMTPMNFIERLFRR